MPDPYKPLLFAGWPGDRAAVFPCVDTAVGITKYDQGLAAKHHAQGLVFKLAGAAQDVPARWQGWVRSHERPGRHVKLGGMPAL